MFMDPKVSLAQNYESITPLPLNHQIDALPKIVKDNSIVFYLTKQLIMFVP